MSVTVHATSRPAERGPHQRLVVLAAVVATLVVVAGPALAAWLGGVGGSVAVDRGPELTSAARRVLEHVSGAFETDGVVVLPAAANPDILWTGALSPDLVVGPVVSLGVRGLAEPGYLPSGGRTPPWLARIGTADQVYDDVGQLSFACTRWPGADDCSGTLLMEHAGEHYIFRSGLHLTPSPWDMSTYLVLDQGRPRNLVIGSAPRTASRVVVTLADGSHEIEAHTSAPGAIHGATTWWASVADPVTAVTFLDADGAVLERASLAG